MHMGMNHFMYKIVNLMPPKLRAFTTLYINLCVDLQEVKCRKNELPLSERKKSRFQWKEKKQKAEKKEPGSFEGGGQKRKVSLEVYAHIHLIKLLNLKQLKFL